MTWEKVKLEDVCSKITSGGTPKSTNLLFYYPEEIPWLKTKEVNYSRIYNTETYISKEGLKHSSAKIIPVNSVIVAMYGQGDTAGRVAINKIPLCTNQACCNLIINSDIADYEYVYYVLVTLYEKFVSLKNGGAQPNLNVAIIKSIEIPLPTLEMQHKISSILSAYDDLIENNQKQIKLLEEAAQRLYKEWFVDLRFPGYETTPIIDGVPEGWETCAIKELCQKVNAGGTPKRGNLNFWNNGTIKWYKTGELKDSWLIDSEEHISVDGLESSSAKLFPKNTIIMAIYASPTLGRLGILSTNGTCNQAALCFIANEKKVSWQWLYQKLYELRDEFNAIAKGAGQQNISADLVKEKIIILPPVKLIHNYTKVVESLFDSKLSLQLKNKLLQEARDRLLPKLMNGELEV